MTAEHNFESLLGKIVVVVCDGTEIKGLVTKTHRHGFHIAGMPGSFFFTWTSCWKEWGAAEHTSLTIEAKLSEAMRAALHGWPDDGQRDRWVRERVLPALAEAGLVVVDNAELERTRHEVAAATAEAIAFDESVEALRVWLRDTVGTNGSALPDEVHAGGCVTVTNWALYTLRRWHGQMDSAAEALARAEQLRDGSRAQCERRTAELAEAMVRLRIADRDATFGRTVLGLADQIVRLRKMTDDRPDAFATDNSPASCAAVLTGELAEVCREAQGSEAAQRECGDVFAAALHLMIAHDACLLAEIDAVMSKIEGRLDVMEEHGCTWSEAKMMVQLSSN